MIGELVLAYGEDRKYRQVQLAVLVMIFGLIVYYSLIEIVLIDSMLTNIIMFIFLFLVAGYSVWYHYKNIANINIAIKY
jgi:hypothetical protein